MIFFSRSKHFWQYTIAEYICRSAAMFLFLYLLCILNVVICAHKLEHQFGFICQICQKFRSLLDVLGLSFKSIPSFIFSLIIWASLISLFKGLTFSGPCLCATSTHNIHLEYSLLNIVINPWNVVHYCKRISL